jgi:hypothetical protein
MKNQLSDYKLDTTHAVVMLLSSLNLISRFLGKFASVTYKTELQFRKRGGLTEAQKQDLFGGFLYKETKITFILGRNHKRAIQLACKAQNIPFVEKPKSDKDSWLKKASGVLLKHATNGQLYLPIVGNKNGVIYSRYVDANGRIWDKKDVETFLLASQSYSDPYQENLGLKTQIPFYLIKVESIKSLSIGGQIFDVLGLDYPKPGK